MMRLVALKPVCRQFSRLSVQSKPLVCPRQFLFPTSAIQLSTQLRYIHANTNLLKQQQHESNETEKSEENESEGESGNGIHNEKEQEDYLEDKNIEEYDQESDVQTPKEQIEDISPVTPPDARRKVPKANKMPPRPKVSESDIKEKFIKGGSGKGGQKINKTNSKVQLTHIPTGIVVTSQATRSREQNRKIAREILALKIEAMEKGEDSRAQIVIERKKMLKARSKKKTKAKYRKLEEEKAMRAEVLMKNTSIGIN